MGGVFSLGGVLVVGGGQYRGFSEPLQSKKPTNRGCCFFLKILETLQILLKEGITSFLCLFNGNKAKSVSNYGSKSHLNIRCSHFLP